MNPDEVLTRVSQLPLSSWQHLPPVDGHGAALASIQALAKRAAAQRRQTDRLQRKNGLFERRLQALETKTLP